MEPTGGRDKLKLPPTPPPPPPSRLVSRFSASSFSCETLTLTLWPSHLAANQRDSRLVTQRKPPPLDKLWVFLIRCAENSRRMTRTGMRAEGSHGAAIALALLAASRGDGAPCRAVPWCGGYQRAASGAGGNESDRRSSEKCLNYLRGRTGRRLYLVDELLKHASQSSQFYF